MFTGNEGIHQMCPMLAFSLFAEYLTKSTLGEGLWLAFKECLLLTQLTSIAVSVEGNAAASFMWRLGLGFPLASASSTESTEGSCVSNLDIQDTKLLTSAHIVSLCFRSQDLHQ